MRKLEDLAAKVAAARDRYDNIVQRQERRIEQFEAPDRGKYGSDDDFKKELAALEKDAGVARKELVLAELNLNNFTERRTLEPAAGAKMAKDAVARVDEEREKRLRRAAGIPDTTGPTDGQPASERPDTRPTNDGFDKKVREGLQQLGILPKDDRRALAEERTKKLEAGRAAERLRKLERAREREEPALNITDPDLKGR